MLDLRDLPLMGRFYWMKWHRGGIDLDLDDIEVFERYDVGLTEELPDGCAVALVQDEPARKGRKPKATLVGMHTLIAGVMYGFLTEAEVRELSNRDILAPHKPVHRLRTSSRLV